jgi:hypothetical protein
LALVYCLDYLGPGRWRRRRRNPQRSNCGGYYYARFNVSANVPGIAPSATYNGNGGGGQLEYNANRWLGVVGDLAGFYATISGNGSFAGGVFTYLLGPRVNFRHGKFTPFAQALFGGVRTTDGIA